MTIHEAIRTLDKLRPGNTFSEKEKISWLSTLDGIIYQEIIKTHEGSDTVSFHGYDGSTDVDTVLLVPSPYCELYLYYLEAQIDFNNAELTKYNNDMTLYNNAYTAFSAWYNRHHISTGRKDLEW